MKPIIILLLSLLPFGAFAGEPAPASAAGEPTVAELSAQLEALKARTSTWDKIAARLPRISGYVQTGYEWSETSSTFFIKRVRLNLAGDIAEKLDYRVQIEFCGPKIVDAAARACGDRRTDAADPWHRLGSDRPCDRRGDHRAADRAEQKGCA